MNDLRPQYEKSRPCFEGTEFFLRVPKVISNGPTLTMNVSNAQPEGFRR